MGSPSCQLVPSLACFNPPSLLRGLPRGAGRGPADADVMPNTHLISRPHGTTPINPLDAPDQTLIPPFKRRKRVSALGGLLEFRLFAGDWTPVGSSIISLDAAAMGAEHSNQGRRPHFP